MRHKWLYVAGGRGCAGRRGDPGRLAPADPGATAGIPQYPQSVQGLRVLEGAVGPGSIAPAQVLVDGGRPGGARSPEVEAAITRLVGELVRDPEVAAAYHADNGRFVDRTGRWAQVIAATRHEYGSEEAQDFARRLRSELIPAARFPEGAERARRGAHHPGCRLPRPGLRGLSLARARGARAHLSAADARFRSLVPPAEGGDPQPALGGGRLRGARRRLPLSGSARTHSASTSSPGRGLDPDLPVRDDLRPLDGLRGLPRLADARGVDETQDNARAVAIGLERTGRIITAAAIVMVAAFSGFMAGSIIGLQEFGCGLAVAVSSTRRSCAACSCPR